MVNAHSKKKHPPSASVPPLPKFLKLEFQLCHKQLHHHTTHPIPIFKEMAPEPPTSKTPKRKSQNIPTKVGSFTVLALTLPKLSGLPTAYSDDAKHYLYIQPHAPSSATATTDRTLFIANIPIDATEANIRDLFTSQLDGSRVSHVEFETAIPAAVVHKRWKGDSAPGAKAKAGVKRKREDDEKKKDDREIVAEGVVEDEKSALPRTWKGEVRMGGSSAVVVFVDRRSMAGAWKEVKRVAKEGGKVRWKGGEGVGIDREYTFDSFSSCFEQAVGF
jgi:ribosomal RNA-processing protein 7